MDGREAGRSANYRRQRTSRSGDDGAGAPWAICVTQAPGTQYIYAADAFPGRVYKLTLDGKVRRHDRQGGSSVKQFGWIHEIACPSENEIYVAELLNWRVQKLLLKPAGARATAAQ